MGTILSTRPFTLRLPDEVREDLKFLSASTNRTQASIASDFLKEKVTAQANRIKATQDAKAEAEKGVFVSQEAMEIWIDSLGTNNELSMPKPDIFPEPIQVCK